MVYLPDGVRPAEVCPMVVRFTNGESIDLMPMLFTDASDLSAVADALNTRAVNDAGVDTIRAPIQTVPGQGMESNGFYKVYPL